LPWRLRLRGLTVDEPARLANVVVTRHLGCKLVDQRRDPGEDGGMPECPENAQGWEIIRACPCPDNFL
jgi:hypothetical protein